MHLRIKRHGIDHNTDTLQFRRSVFDDWEDVPIVEEQSREDQKLEKELAAIAEERY